jgi:hypothetical protein
MKLSTILVTGSSGLIGSDAVKHFDRQGTRAQPYRLEANSGRCLSVEAVLFGNDDGAAEVFDELRLRQTVRKKDAGLSQYNTRDPARASP